MKTPPWRKEKTRPKKTELRSRLNCSNSYTSLCKTCNWIVQTLVFILKEILILRWHKQISERLNYDVLGIPLQGWSRPNSPIFVYGKTKNFLALHLGALYPAGPQFRKKYFIVESRGWEKDVNKVATLPACEDVQVLWKGRSRTVEALQMLFLSLKPAPTGGSRGIQCTLGWGWVSKFAGPSLGMKGAKYMD
jgi:hypothetical protein